MTAEASFRAEHEDESCLVFTEDEYKRFLFEEFLPTLLIEGLHVHAFQQLGEEEKKLLSSFVLCLCGIDSMLTATWDLLVRGKGWVLEALEAVQSQEETSCSTLRELERYPFIEVFVWFSSSRSCLFLCAL